MLWRRRKRRASQEVKAYNDALDEAIDALEKIRYFVSLVEKKALDDKRLNDYITGLYIENRMNIMLHNIITIASDLLENRENNIHIFKKIYEIIKRYVSKAREEVLRHCSLFIETYGRPRVAIAGRSELIRDCVYSLGGRISVVEVLEARPYGDGATLVRELREKRIEARLLPDYAVQQAVDNADLVLMSSIALTYDEWAFLRSGNRALVLAAEDRGKDSVNLTFTAAFTAILSGLSMGRATTANVYIKEINNFISIELYEKINYRRISYIIYEKGVQEPPHIDVEGEAYDFMHAVVEELGRVH